MTVWVFESTFRVSPVQRWSCGRLERRIYYIYEVRKRFLYCAWGERERDRQTNRQTEREREERERETEVTSPLSCWNWRGVYTFPCQKITLFVSWRWVCTFPCQKIALFASPFTLPVALKFAMSSLTLSVAKKNRTLCFDSLKWRDSCDEWSKTQDKWSNPAQS